MIEPTTILFLIGAYYALKIWLGLMAFAIAGVAALAAIHAKEMDGK